MEIILFQFFSKFFGVLALIVLVHCQDQSGFISLDCGLPGNTSYSDATTTLNFISDASYIEIGISKSLAPEFSTNSIFRPLWYVRSFPQGSRNCYNVTLTKDTEYLIRATFMYGNYDGINQRPSFDLYLGPNKWVSVQILNGSIPVRKEIIHHPKRKYIHVCLVNTNSGTPFISALELRPLKNGTYVSESGSLALFDRADISSITNQTVRYPDDVYDRRWSPFHFVEWTDISTTETIDLGKSNSYQLPSTVMRSAGTPRNSSSPMEVTIAAEDPTLKFYAYFHFAEIVKLDANQSREFNITLNGDIWYGPITLHYLYSTTVSSGYAISGGTYDFQIFKVGGSTLPPLLNAVEVYYIVELLQLETKQEDVYAMIKIKSTYKITRNWQGDPCAPQDYVWEGLKCNYSNSASPVIISLDLSSSGLTGDVPPVFANLKSLESLDLSNNSLTGPVPDFLSQLKSLKVLDLTGNKLTGIIPDDLFKRSQSGLLLLSFGGNPELCASVSCSNNNKKKKKNNNFVVPVVASIAALLVIVAALTIICCCRRRKQQVARNEEADTKETYEPREMRNRRFTYSEVLKLTKNFESVLGRGGFGTVYYGYLGDIEVAVKVLSTSSVQGYKEFEAEVKLLLRVHHKNLTTLVGYCDEGGNMILIYEYMANGNLRQHLSGEHPDILSWEGRLKIALETAQGLEYLHNGCKPPIVHRDVKTANILLDDKFQAKLADFGLSRMFPAEGGTHVSTIVAGTPGYLDPEYYVRNWLTEKSDVYSFGVVLLEIITSRSVISQTSEKTHVSQWVKPMLERGDIKNIVDSRLCGDFDTNTAWKAAELAMACVSATSTERPSMSQVVMELSECLKTEMARTREGYCSAQSNSSAELMSVNVLSTVLSPRSR
ncbi:BRASSINOSTEROID INSENSITIVE 1-associated receptor kinase 1 precursor, putative [Ricinus communis]|uniref:non-specific serine/threonine protein kinase n=1 Tax=Ricinus communis TaxID=3988 RepID=B9RQ85_RICCO|nr:BRASSINOSTEROID INSENSITIVE 1-associated receptor kinase 1 precursor, putative [Ricinus communis]|eukprot:XP_025012579.1 LRR receptor-like serine/threonine-protein kinase IOS1 isoform X1 [Ricinus communis]